MAIEGLIGSAFADTLSGDDGPNTIAGGSGADVLVGRGGSDILLGENGMDRADGGDGVDLCEAETVTACEEVTDRSAAVRVGGTGTPPRGRLSRSLRRVTTILEAAEGRGTRPGRFR